MKKLECDCFQKALLTHNKNGAALWVRAGKGGWYWHLENRGQLFHGVATSRQAAFAAALAARKLVTP